MAVLSDPTEAREMALAYETVPSARSIAAVAAAMRQETPCTRVSSVFATCLRTT
jgi:hypothetical protein